MKSEYQIDHFEELEFIISPNQTKERIDKFIFSKLKQISRNKIQNLIEKGYIKVNGKEIKTNYKIAPNDQIEVAIPRPKPIEINPENIPIDFAYQDDYLAIVNKQAGLVVHPTYAATSGTLVNALLYHFNNQLSSINGELRPGIVHRLDKDTTGLMVVAKNDLVHSPLSLQFAEKTAIREYYGICIGKFKEKKGRIETLLHRSPRDRKLMAVSKFEGKIAITNYQVLEEFNFFTLVKFVLETGRTHQIRVHMKYLNKPLFGDRTYGGDNISMLNMAKNQNRRLEHLLEIMKRQALHAKSLEIYHPILKKRMKFESKLPSDMEEVLELLKKYDY